MVSSLFGFGGGLFDQEPRAYAPPSGMPLQDQRKLERDTFDAIDQGNKYCLHKGKELLKRLDKMDKDFEKMDKIFKKD